MTPFPLVSRAATVHGMIWQIEMSKTSPWCAPSQTPTGSKGLGCSVCHTSEQNECTQRSEFRAQAPHEGAVKGALPLRAGPASYGYRITNPSLPLLVPELQPKLNSQIPRLRLFSRRNTDWEETGSSALDLGRGRT